MPIKNINTIRENIFYAVVLIYVISLPFSEALVSIAAGLLLIQSVVLTSWKHPSVKHGSTTSLLMITSVLLVYFLGIIKTEDIHFTIYEIRKVAFWAIIPVAFFISPALSQNRFRNALFAFCFSVFIASLVATVKLIYKDYFQVEGFRDITMISHLRYSFQIVLSIIILMYFLLSGYQYKSLKYFRVFLVILTMWMIFFLIFLKSITGILAFIGTVFAFLIFYIVKIKKSKVKVFALIFMSFLIATPLLYVAFVWNDFYTMEKLEPQKVDKFTMSGNPYYFDFSSYEKENGHWVNAYICETELREEWNKISNSTYDSLDANGYAYSTTLKRYLTSKGLRKDSVGVSKLTEKDIRAIEAGISNHIYIDHKFSLYPRIYETIWELDRYSHTGNPNYQSFSQRIEYAKASFLLIKQNPWLGIGTGNWKIEFAKAYKEMDSKLKLVNQGSSHNQYLNYMVKFGVIGFVYIFSMLIIPVFREGHRNNLLFLLFLISMAVANLGDANFESHMGLSFFCFFYCFFLWHSPKKLKHITYRENFS